MQPYPFFLATVFLFISFSIKGQPWELALVKEGITVYTRTISSSDYKEFKGETTIAVSAQELADEIMKVEDYPRWCYRTTSSKFIKKEDNKVYYYCISETPAVLKNREGYYCNQISTDEKTKTIIIKMNTFESNEPIPKNFTRVPLTKGLWTLKPLTEKRTNVVFEMQAEPGGAIPSWLANLVVVESPFETLDHLRKLVMSRNSSHNTVGY